ncbi:MAG: hypothetical protein M1501_04460 [Candidatus Omnitrophica bacterium]|nr:hypothetical protein [Candidatus Omnitrophota bacterium]
MVRLLFFQKEDEVEQIRRYIDGYKRKPEDIKEIEGLAKSSIETWGMK